MGVRKKLKSFLHIKPRKEKHGAYTVPHASAHPAVTNANFYQHPNAPIQPNLPLPRPISTDLREPLNFVPKAYTTASGVVIPPDFSYERTGPVYQVSGALPLGGLRGNDEDGDLDFRGGAAQAASEYSVDTLNRMTELALAAHEPDTPLREVSPRPLPEIPSAGGRVGNANGMQRRRRIRILTGMSKRKVNGLQVPDGGDRGRR